AAIDPPREESHTLVLYRAPIQGPGAEAEKIRGFEKLWQNRSSVVSGVGGIVEDAAIVLDEANEAGVLHAVGLVGRDGKDDALRNGDGWVEVHLVIGLRQPADA